MLQFSGKDFFLLDDITFQPKLLKRVIKEYVATEKLLQANKTQLESHIMRIFPISDTVPNFVRKMLLKHSSPSLLLISSYKDFFADINRKASCENIAPVKIVFCVETFIGFILPSVSHSTGDPAPGVQSTETEVSLCHKRRVWATPRERYLCPCIDSWGSPSPLQQNLNFLVNFS